MYIYGMIPTENNANTVAELLMLRCAVVHTDRVKVERKLIMLQYKRSHAHFTFSFLLNYIIKMIMLQNSYFGKFGLVTVIVAHHQMTPADSSTNLTHTHSHYYRH